MNTDLFEVYLEHGCTAERTLENALWLALQACCAPDSTTQPVFALQLFIPAFCSVPPEERDPKRFNALLASAVQHGWLAAHGGDTEQEDFVTPSGWDRARELGGTLHQLWRTVRRSEFNLLARATPDDLTWEYQRGILLKVYHRDVTFAYPRRLRRELGEELWKSYLPPTIDEGTGAVDALQSAVTSFTPIPEDDWALGA